MKQLLFIVLLSSFAFDGCSVKKQTVSLMGSIAWEGQTVLEKQPDVELARETTPALLLSLDVLRQSNPENFRFAALVAKGYGQYAYGFYEEDLLRYLAKDKIYQTSFDRADRFYRTGRDVGLTALQKRRSFRKALHGSLIEFEKELDAFEKEDAPILFWTAFCWGGWLNLHRDDPAAIVELPKVTALIERVLELSPDFAYGSAYSFRGVLNASRPPMLGGNPGKATEAFKKAIAIEPRYLMTKVLYAQYYAVQVQDRDLFQRLLKEVVAADETLFPEQLLANALAKRRAELLLTYQERWF